MEQCEKCFKVFKLKTSFQRHLSTTECGKRKVFECESCTYTTVLKNNLSRHVASCKYVYAAQQMAQAEQEKEDLAEETRVELDRIKKENDAVSLSIKKKNDAIIQKLKKEKEVEAERVKMLRQKIKDLKAENLDYRLQLREDKGQIKVYKERPSTTINATTTNYINPKLLQIKCDTIRPFTIETVREDVQAGKFTFDRFIKAEKGLIEFLADIISQDTELSYVCTDSSRHKFHRLLESREWKDDNGASFLNKVLDELKEPTIDHHKKITDMMITGDQDTADFLREKTKSMVTGITCPTSKNREITFNKVRNEVKKLATI